MAIAWRAVLHLYPELGCCDRFQCLHISWMISLLWQHVWHVLTIYFTLAFSKETEFLNIDLT